MLRKLLLFLPLLVSACVTHGSPRLEACLSDPNVMPAYRASPAKYKTVIGGVDKQGAVHCYWQEYPTAMKMPWFTSRNAQCEQEAGPCTVIASGDAVLLNYAAILEPRTINGPTVTAQSSSFDLRPIWHLIGEFAEAFVSGYAMGVGYAATAPRPVVVNVPAASAPKPSFQCTPQMGFLVDGAPNYVCR